MNNRDAMVTLKVEGMTCTGCASTIERFLRKQDLKQIQVSFVDGSVKFERKENLDIQALARGIHQLGYNLVLDQNKRKGFRLSLKAQLLISVFFTLPLLLNHISPVSLPYFHSSLTQLLWALPPTVIGLARFLPGAFRSVKSGVPNMDVTVCLGAIAAMGYSLTGLFLGEPTMIFFETGASILTLVLLGNFIEQKAIKKTTNAIDELQSVSAEYGKMKMPSGAIVNIPLKDIQPGDLLIVSEGDAIPGDGKILTGSGLVDESIMTGESKPLKKNAGDKLIGSSQLISGNFTMKVEQTGGESYFGRIISLVKDAALQKAPIQNTADRISAIFVPVISGLSLITFFLTYFIFHLTISQAVLRAIAVLVISCPCAMGLATPTAIIVGLGKAMKEGILIKGATTLELLGRMQQIVLDKTGTLTSPSISIEVFDKIDSAEVVAAIYSMESRSSHPIAKAILDSIDLKQYHLSTEFKVIEHKGKGLSATDAGNNEWEITWSDTEGIIEVIKNKERVAQINLSDHIKNDASSLISYLKKENIVSYILSGDSEERVEHLAGRLSVQNWFGRIMPDQKITVLNRLKPKGITGMVGDGINDAPALSIADIAISFGNASNAAIQSSQVILLNDKLGSVGKAIHIGKMTLQTIRQNLFWAFSYNIIAIPLAALGYLDPMWGAAFMAFSDLVVIGNSMILRWSKI